MFRNFEVIIIGAGPAGATLAFELARKGISVAILEREKLPRYKCCAGGLSVKAAKLLDPEVFNIVENEITRATFSFVGDKPFSRQDNQIIGYTVMRDKFDYALTKSAEKAGAVVFQLNEARKIITDDIGVKVFSPADYFQSKFLVGADGSLGRVARDLNFQRKIKNYAIAIEAEVRVAKEVKERWNSQVSIDLGRISGYAWVFPKSDHLSIGIACHSSKAKGLKQHYQEFLDSLHLGPHTVARRRGSLIPMCTGKVSAVQNRVLLLGDAAGLVDPLTGEGIYNAILSARLAAPVIERSLQGNPGSLYDYQAALEKEILPDLKIAHSISSVFFRFPILALSFRALNRDDRIWRTGCSVLRGETNYLTIKNRLKTLGGIYSFLSAK
jgi:geranylgeranyl reductase family protein